MHHCIYDRFKDKRSLRSHQTVEIKVFSIFFIVGGRIRIQIRTNNYGYGSGSWRPRNGTLVCGVWTKKAGWVIVLALHNQKCWNEPGCASGPEQQRYRGLQLGGGSHHHALPDHQVSTTYNQCCGSGSGIRCLFDPWTRIRNRFFPDPGSRIPDPKPILLRA